MHSCTETQFLVTYKDPPPDGYGLKSAPRLLNAPKYAFELTSGQHITGRTAAFLGAILPTAIARNVKRPGRGQSHCASLTSKRQARCALCEWGFNTPST